MRKVKYIDRLYGGSLSALRVSAANKLHNVRATTSAVRESGAWAELNACHHQSLWYYDAVNAVVSKRMPCNRTAIELDLAVSEFYGLSAHVQRLAQVEPYVQCNAAATVSTVMSSA